MLLKRNELVKDLRRLREVYLVDCPEEINVHKSLLVRAAELVRRVSPESADFFSDVFDIMLEYCVMPDKIGDYEKGMGRHYYCAVGYSGRSVSPIKGYYRNGIARFSKSARTMLEEDYTMALSLWNAGCFDEAAQHLGRAVHMISDANCLPHATCMTYFSPMRNVHKAYEDLAWAIYPYSVREQSLTADKLKMFSDRKSFAAALNAIAEGQKREIKLLAKDPVRELRYRLYAAERAVASLLVRFREDCGLPPEKAHYIADGMKCRLFGKFNAVAEISGGAVRFVPDNNETQLERAVLVREFYAAHRSSGLFTLSPVSDKLNGRVLCSDGSLRAFDPTDKRQLFRLI